MARQGTPGEQRLATAQAELEIERRLTPHLPAGGRLYAHAVLVKSSSTVAKVTYGDNHGMREPWEAKLPPGFEAPATWDRALELALALPPIAAVDVRDGCRGFDPAEFFESLPEAKRARSTATEIGPVRFELGAFPSRGPGRAHVTARWYAKLPTGDLIDVEVELGSPPKGVLEYTVERRGLRGRSPNYDEPHVGAFCSQVVDEREVVALMSRPITWGGGSADYPKSTTIIFHHCGKRLPADKLGQATLRTFADLVMGRTKLVE
jgi:hypothetical protein